ncbi:MAG TPA: PQQ-binding-like beta-propeller repeat protein [Planctomycetota bacterium]|nr:PQQ-binding-like beta-propeller repeat protein [Planctomycetota bacterium]
MSLDCVAAEERFSANIDNELPAVELHALNDHIRGCAACAAGLFRLRASLGALRALPSPTSDDLVARILGAVAATRPAVARPQAWFARVGAALSRPRPRLRRATVAAVAATLVIAIAAATGAWAGRAAATPPAEMLAGAGLVAGDDGWLPAAERAQRASGKVWIDGAWRDRDAAREALVGAVEPRHGAWLDPAAREALAGGRVLTTDGWTTDAAIVDAAMRAAELERDGRSWIAAEDRGVLRLGGRPVEARDIVAQHLAGDDYVRDADGRWRPAQDLRHERAGAVRVAGEWLTPDQALTRWMGDRGYALVDGRWRDPGAPSDTPPRDERQAAAAAAKAPADEWIAMTALPGPMDGRVSDEAARLTLKRVRSVSVAPGIKAAANAVPFVTADGMRGWRVALVGDAFNRSPGIVLGTPALLDGRVHVGGGFSSTTAYAFAAETGRLAWASQLSDNGPSSPVPHGDDIAYATESCSVYLLSGRSGRSEFGRHIGDPVRTMPAIAQRVLMCTAPADGGFALIGQELDRKRAWAAPLGSDLRTAPIVVDGNVIGATRGGALMCWRASDGVEQWRNDIGALSPPTIAGGDRLIVRRALSARAGATFAETFATVAVADGSIGEERLGEPRVLSSPTVSSTAAPSAPLLDPQGRLPDLGPVAWTRGCAVALRGDALEAVSVADGRTLWSVPLGRPPEFAIGSAASATHSDLCLAGDLVLVGTLGGDLCAYRVASGELAWRARIAAPIGNLPVQDFTMFRVQPVVGAGRAYVTTLHGDLVCVETGDGSLEGSRWWGHQP